MNIEVLLKERSRHRRDRNWALADEIHAILQNRFCSLEIIDHADGTTTVQEKVDKENFGPVVWSKVKFTPTVADDGPIPIHTFIATCNEPHYVASLKNTFEHFHNCAPDCFSPITPVPLLSLHETTLPSKRIVWEGWLQLLLPTLLTLPSSLPFILVVEDDVRIFPFTQDIHIFTLNRTIQAMFAAHQDCDVISLGNSGAKFNLHGATALALRTSSLPRIHSVLSSVPTSRRSHLDLFLFSQPHSLSVAISDPPLFGWCECEETLTPAGSGQRRKGGGRLAAVEVGGGTCLDWYARGVS